MEGILGNGNFWKLFLSQIVIHLTFVDNNYTMLWTVRMEKHGC